MLSQNNDNVFVIIPVFNEKKEVLVQTIRELQKASYSIVVVNDASANDISLPGIGITYSLRHEVNLGQGAALQTGIEFALQKKATYLVTFDADGQHSSADIPALCCYLYDTMKQISHWHYSFLKFGHHCASFPASYY